jgi:hypothetical protein
LEQILTLEYVDFEMIDGGSSGKPVRSSKS